MAALRLAIARNYPQPVDAKAVGRNLRRIRRAAKESQQTVAARMGVVQVQISEWEIGKYKSFDMETLFRLAKAYSTTIEALLVGVDIEYDRHRDLIRHRADQSSDLSRGGRTDARTVSASVGLQQPDPVLVKTLEDVGRLVTNALSRAKGEEGQLVHPPHAGTGKNQPQARRRVAGDR